jgi:hypothetical protein
MCVDREITKDKVISILIFHLLDGLRFFSAYRPSYIAPATFN